MLRVRSPQPRKFRAVHTAHYSRIRVRVQALLPANAREESAPITMLQARLDRSAPVPVWPGAPRPSLRLPLRSAERERRARAVGEKSPVLFDRFFATVQAVAATRARDEAYRLRRLRRELHCLHEESVPGPT